MDPEVAQGSRMFLYGCFSAVDNMVQANTSNGVIST